LRRHGRRAMNMLGNLAGFVGPVVGGLILLRTGGNWNPLIYLMVGAATISALCWLYLDPENADRKPAGLAAAVKLISTPIANF
jgi:MFS transporter, ACS family, glucarate transporter